MTKTERRKIMSRLKPQSWYTYCQLEVMTSSEVLKGTKTEIAGLLNISLPTLAKYIEIWQGQGLVREIPGGLVITQMDGQLNPEVMVTEELPPRQYNARKIIDYWCFAYEGKYHQPYRVSNWAMTMNQAKKILRYSDLEIERTIDAVMALYEKKWASPKFPRPTFGALISFLFEQAKPYADFTQVVSEEVDINVVESSTNFMDEIKAKGW